jgi:hypothetical protein
MLPGKRKISRITAMQKAEIKQIADYLKDLEEGLVEWDYRGIATQYHLTQLHEIIPQGLDDDIFIKTKLQHSASSQPADKLIAKAAQYFEHICI